MLEPMLYQKCRPETIDDYVFVDKDMESKFKEWVKKGQIPNVIISGPPGTGKCLDGKEPINVLFNTSTLNASQYSRFKSINNNKSEFVSLIITMEELFYILGHSTCEYEKAYQLMADVKIMSPTGYVPINHVVKKRTDTAKYEFSNGESITCSTKHVVFQNGSPVKISDASQVDFIDCKTSIISVKLLGERDVYDVALDDPHQYVTPNGLVHHNTTISYLLCKEIGYDDSDVKVFDCSTDTGIDIVRDRIRPFVETVSHSKKGRVVILEEFEGLSKQSQQSLKCIIIDNMDNARFIMLTNNPHRIDSAIHSRAPTFHVEALDKDHYTYRVAEVLTDEGIKFDMDTLMYYVNKNYPDMRKVFNDVERYTFDNVLKIKSSSSEVNSTDWMMKAVACFQENMHREGRDIVCKNISYHEYEEFYRTMYENIDWWANGNNDKRDKALITIKEHLVDDSSVGDREIVLASCLTALSMI